MRTGIMRFGLLSLTLAAIGYVVAWQWGKNQHAPLLRPALHKAICHPDERAIDRRGTVSSRRWARSTRAPSPGEPLLIRTAAQDSDVETHLRASRKYDESGDPAKAVAEAQAAIELDPGSLAARLQLGQIFLGHNTPAPAAEIFSDALALAPDSILAHLGRGLALRDLQEFDDAEKELTYCLSRDPKLGIALDALGGIYLQISKAAELTAVSRRYIETNPSDHRGYYYLAAAMEHEKRTGAGIEDLLRQSLKLNPNFAASHALLGKMLAQEDRLDEAVRELERATGLRPDYGPAHLYLGNAYRKLGRSADAAREFQTLRELNDKQRSQPSLLYHRGQKNN